MTIQHHKINECVDLPMLIYTIRWQFVKRFHTILSMVCLSSALCQLQRTTPPPASYYRHRVTNTVVWHYSTVISLAADVNTMMCDCCVQNCAADVTADR